MSKRKGFFVDNTFEPPIPRHDGRIPVIGEVADVIRLSWKEDNAFDYPIYQGRYEVIAITKKHVIAKIIGSMVAEEFDLRLVKQRNIIFVHSNSRDDPEPIFRSPRNDRMLPTVARRVAEQNIDLNAGEVKPHECRRTFYIEF